MSQYLSSNIHMIMARNAVFEARFLNIHCLYQNVNLFCKGGNIAKQSGFQILEKHEKHSPF